MGSRLADPSHFRTPGSLSCNTRSSTKNIRARHPETRTQVAPQAAKCAGPLANSSLRQQCGRRYNYRPPCSGKPNPVAPASFWFTHWTSARSTATLHWMHFPSDQLTVKGGDTDCANSPYEKQAAKDTAAQRLKPMASKEPRSQRYGDMTYPGKRSWQTACYSGRTSDGRQAPGRWYIGN